MDTLDNLDPTSRMLLCRQKDAARLICEMISNAKEGEGDLKGSIVMDLGYVSIVETYKGGRTNYTVTPKSNPDDLKKFSDLGDVAAFVLQRWW